MRSVYIVYIVYSAFVCALLLLRTEPDARSFVRSTFGVCMWDRRIASCGLLVKACGYLAPLRGPVVGYRLIVIGFVRVPVPDIGVRLNPAAQRAVATCSACAPCSPISIFLPVPIRVIWHCMSCALMICLIRLMSFVVVILFFLWLVGFYT